ncbi:Ger(x)C family spore germination protein [Clostridium folliculivorans]|uniref:Germination protein n=1 Tax=Clostridium folliculivorans TaxID=2886038 RepID=A0A9W5Y4B1_9CLOT|nr:Ger(x)C family spore germination protein [Clostridium folliculivorans]GKU26314.1 germination protein [Clostridium folliculivorans]GKU32131.1 germination protein [Clostridium folliculivorans]
MRKYKLLILILYINLIITGCSFKDIDKRFFVVSMGIDQSEKSANSYIVTLKLAVPNTEPKRGESNFIMFTQEADNISEAVGLIKSKVDKELDFSHLKVILFDKKLASADLKIPIDWPVRRRDVPMSTLVGIGSPSANATIGEKISFERAPSNALILSMDGSGTITNYITPQYLFDLERRRTELGLDPILPIIESDKSNKAGDIKNRTNSYTINQLALFEKKDSLKIKLILNPEETKLYNLIASSHTRANFHVNYPQSNFVFDINDSKCKYKFETNDKDITNINLKLTVSGSIEETIDNLKTNNIKICEEEAELFLQERIQALLEKIQNNEVDPMGLGLHYRARHLNVNNNNEWANWQKLYRSLQFNVKVDVKLKSTGLIK